ncbi:MAG TPA: MFS transporter [Clostridiales bacterium]|nr:MFS transporter [Clostridiales bacterium]
MNRIPLGEKVAFGLANMGNIPVMSLIGSFLLIFYTDIAGINPAAVATLFIISRVLDGVNDPVMGFIIDHLPKTKMGRFRPYLIIGVILCAINYLLLWFGPIMFPGIKLVIVYVTYLLIGLTFDLMDIPLNSMIPVMTDDEKERGSLSTIKGASYMVGALTVGIIAPMILAATGGSLSGYILLVGGAVAVVLTFSIIGALGLKERVQPISEEKYKLSDVIPILTERPVLFTFMASLFMGVGGAVGSSSGIYFATYVLDNKLEVMSMISMCSMVGMFIGMFVAGRLTGRLGKKNVFAGGIILAGMFSLIRLFSVTNIPLIYFCTLFAGMGTGGAMTLAYGIQADNVDYIEFKRGTRAEGALASLNSFVIKAGQGFGGAIPGYILAATGYVAKQQQTSTAITGIIFIAIVIPAIINVLGGIIFTTGYSLDKNKLSEVMASLRARREEKLKAPENVSLEEVI